MNDSQTNVLQQKTANYTKIDEHTGITRFFAHLFSFIFHPLFISLYAGYYLAYLHPGYFNGISEREKMWVLLRMAVNIVFFPAVSVFLLKGVGLIDSVFLRTRKERIIPYIISNIFFFWMYLVFRNQSEIPTIVTSFIFSVFLSSSIALLANTYFKISMHAIGVGGLLGLMLVILYTNTSSPITVPLAVTILIAGIVCTSRMIVSNHTQKDIYVGLLFGILCQLAGAAFVL
jgi:hypothetical protein